jgi:hypothetical protein
LNIPSPQVHPSKSVVAKTLSDGINHDIYGLGKIAQVHTNSTEYFIGDALGSVRQLPAANGMVTSTTGISSFGLRKLLLELRHEDQCDPAMDRSYGFDIL